MRRPTKTSGIAGPDDPAQDSTTRDEELTAAGVDGKEPPALLTPVYDAIAPALKSYTDRWAPWRAKWNPGKGKYDKVPHPGGGSSEGWAQSTKWSTLTATREIVERHPDRYAGPGFLMKGAHLIKIVALDLDRCVRDGVLDDWAMEIVNRAQTYAEISPSNRGIRLFLFGTWPRDWQDHDRGIEVYSGHAPRFLTVTGHHLTGTPDDLQEAPAGFLEWLSETYEKQKDDVQVIDAPMPALLDEIVLPDIPYDMLPEAAAAFLRDGPRDGDDRSARLQGATVGLYQAGLTDAEVLSVLWDNQYAKKVALDHRHGNKQKSLLYLWAGHCQPAQAKLVTVDEFEDEGEPAAPKVESAAPKDEPAKRITLQPITLDELRKARLTPRVIVPDLLFADLRFRFAAGGTGKTTLALYEAAMLALGKPVWGQVPQRPGRTLLVTREDGRELLVARLREVMDAMSMFMGDDEQQQVLENVNIHDMSGENFRLSKIKNDTVVPHKGNLQMLVDAAGEFRPDWLIFDPLVSFGVGEQRVNDAEQGLIESFRILRNALDCCVEGIHHVGKTNARDKVVDQYAGRGGSALSDGARMVAVMQPMEAKEWANATGSALDVGESGMVMALPKLSFAQPQPHIYIRRTGYAFQQVEAAALTTEDKLQRAADLVYAFLEREFAQGRKYSRKALRSSHERIGLTRDGVEAAAAMLEACARISYFGGQGKAGSHFIPGAPKS